MSNNTAHKTIKTGQNTQESPVENQKSDFATPFYNMGVTISDSRLQSDQFTFPRKLDNLKMMVVDGKNLPVLHSVPCDEYGFASLDWVTFSICHETLGSEYAFIDPEKVDETLTYGIEIWLDQHLYEIFGFGLGQKRQNGMHNYKFSYELQDMFGMVLYGHSSKRIAIQINGTGCALARKGWEQRLYRFLNTFAKRPKLNRIDLAHDDFTGEHLTVDLANQWDTEDGFWCGGRKPNVNHIGNWKRPNGKGRTFAIGDRTTGKYGRIYERGRKEGNPLSPWTRAEVEFKSKDRHIPLDILLEPSKYFVGAYPCFKWLADQLKQDFITPEKIKTVKKQSEINWDRAIEITKEQFGKYIRQFAKVFEPSELITMLSSSKDEVPKRLKFSHAAVMQSIRLNEPIQKNHSEEYPLFVGVPLVNQSMYQEFIHAV